LTASGTMPGMNTTGAFIRREKGCGDAWICLCGNTPESDGFYPCDALGNSVEQTEMDWDGRSYVCHRCEWMVDQQTLAVIGRAAPGRRF
jgi:hypothetical protein